MAKNDTTKVTDADAAAAPEAGTTGTTVRLSKAPPLPALGTSCTVRVPEGVSLMNNETGQHFAAETDTPVTVDITLLRRLQDGDLTLVG